MSKTTLAFCLLVFSWAASAQQKTKTFNNTVSFMCDISTGDLYWEGVKPSENEFRKCQNDHKKLEEENRILHCKGRYTSDDEEECKGVAPDYERIRMAMAQCDERKRAGQQQQSFCGKLMPLPIAKKLQAPQPTPVAKTTVANK